jgi:type I restriction enzyme S subunit
MHECPGLDVRPDLLAIVRDILRRHVPEREVWAFGSRVQGRAKRYSDLDLAIVSEIPLPLRVQTRLADDFTDSDLPWRVDVVDWATTSETFRQIIERQKVIIQRAGRLQEAERARHVTAAPIAGRPTAVQGRIRSTDNK